MKIFVAAARWAPSTGLFALAEDVVPQGAAKSAIEASIARAAKALIVARATSGFGLTGGREKGTAPLPRYRMAGRLSVPMKRFPGEEESGLRRRRYEQRMATARSNTRRKGGSSTITHGKRRWLQIKGGYMALRAAAGLTHEENLMFTGVMMEDFAVRATIEVNQGAKKHLASYFSGIFSRNIKLFATHGIRRTGIRQNQRGAAAGSVFQPAPSNVAIGGEVPLYNVVLEYGFSTTASARIAHFLHMGTAKRAPRRWIGVSTEEAQRISKMAAELIARGGASGSPPKAGILPGGGRLLQARDPQTGRFIPFTLGG